MPFTGGTGGGGSFGSLWCVLAVGRPAPLCCCRMLAGKLWPVDDNNGRQPTAQSVRTTRGALQRNLGR